MSTTLDTSSPTTDHHEQAPAATSRSAAALPARLTVSITPAGRRLIAKHHHERDRYERERDTYRDAAPFLGDLIPDLVGADDQRMILVLTQIDARTACELEPGSPAETDAHHAAGAALRRIHRLRPALHNPAHLPASLATRLRAWTETATRSQLLSEQENTLLERAADTIAATPLEPAVCHLDYQPQNWLIRPDGRLVVIDFEHTRTDARLRDFARLAHRHWTARPDLRTAFLDGYGQPLTTTEDDLLHHFGALEAATALVRGTQRQDTTLIRHGRQALARLTRTPAP